VGKPQKHSIFTSCAGLRVLAPLVARALFLGCTVRPLLVSSISAAVKAKIVHFLIKA